MRILKGLLNKEDCNERKYTGLMSTYNGEKYLRNQIDSILSQENVNVSILVRDDGSEDGTLKILEDYEVKVK